MGIALVLYGYNSKNQCSDITYLQAQSHNCTNLYNAYILFNRNCNQTVQLKWQLGDANINELLNFNLWIQFFDTHYEAGTRHLV